jgi:hypothetical protein
MHDALLEISETISLAQKRLSILLDEYHSCEAAIGEWLRNGLVDHALNGEGERRLVGCDSG